MAENLALGVKVATFYMQRGIPLNGACAITAVQHAESGLNPGSQGDQPSETPGVLNPRGAFGLSSWNGPRQGRHEGDTTSPEGLNDFAKKNNLDFNQIETQQLFTLNEIANHYPRSWEAIRNASEPIDSIITVLVDEYENPKDKAGEINRAAAYAARLAPLLGHVSPAPTPAPAPVPPSPLPPSPTPSPSPDPELVAIEIILHQLGEFTDTARRRMLGYISLRLQG